MTEAIQKKNFFRDSSLGQAWLVLIMAIVFGALLAMVQLTLSPKIAANMQAETFSAVPVLIYGEGNVPADAKVETSAITVKSGSRDLSYPVYIVKSGGKVTGFAVKGSIMGYADYIEMLVGFNADVSEVTGIFVVYQKETPGLGSKITETDWNGQFTGKSTATPLAVNSKDAKANIDSISGATISSVAVTDIVNNIVRDVKSALIKKAGE